MSVQSIKPNFIHPLSLTYGRPATDFNYFFGLFGRRAPDIHTHTRQNYIFLSQAFIPHTHTLTLTYFQNTLIRLSGAAGVGEVGECLVSLKRVVGDLFLNFLNLLADDDGIVAPNLLCTVLSIIETAVVFVTVPMDCAEQTSATALET